MEVADFSLLDIILTTFAVVIVMVMLRRPVRDAPFWRATVTPLASIIGSGFLVVVPLLAHITGTQSIIAITAIVLLSFWIGASIRLNIRLAEHEQNNGGFEQLLERLSDITLAVAYVISIAFYIRLLSGFVLSGADSYTPFNANALATLVLSFIGIYGLIRGLQGLERLEEYSVTIKLAIIAALLLGLVFHDVENGYSFAGLATPDSSLLERASQLAGMLLIVQGFETSKYLGPSYDAPTKSRSMLFAQLLAGAVYVAFVVLAMPLMDRFNDRAPDETAIIELSGAITLVLPMMLVLAATMSQFSAAIADTIGAGGVVENETEGRVSAKISYFAIAVLATGLIWNSNIFEVISFASRAFAFYYMLQAILSARLAARTCGGRRRLVLFYSNAALATLLFLIVVFATPVQA